MDVPFKEVKLKSRNQTQSEDTAERWIGWLKCRPQTSDLRPQTQYLELPANHKQKATKSLRNWGVPLLSNENLEEEIRKCMTLSRKFYDRLRAT